MRIANKMPNIDLINESFIHNNDGSFTWKSRPLRHFPDERAMKIWNTKYSGKKCVGSKKYNGYVYFTFFNKSLSSHRLAWFIHNGHCDENLEIDHINGIRNDNRIENLRMATPSNNQHNKKIQKNNTSGYKNVVWNKQCKKWQVIINVNKKGKHIGLYDSIEDAAESAKNARYNLLKSFANGY